MYNSALGSVVMELGRRMWLPIPGPAPFGLQRTATRDHGRRTCLAGWSLPRQPERDSRLAPAVFPLPELDGRARPLSAFSRRGSPVLGRPDPLESRSPHRQVAGTLCEPATPPPPEQRRQRQRELEDVRRRLTDLYDECLYGLDAELGRFLRELRAEGRLANTWVVITADHGEHFGEHDHFGHGSSLYNEQTHVPLVLIPPLGAEETGTDCAARLRGRRVAVPVSHRDLPRTLTELLIPGAENPFPGRSLARASGATVGPSGPIPSSPNWSSRASSAKTLRPIRWSRSIP